MKDTIDKLISFLEADNKAFLSDFPDKEPTFEYNKATDKDIQDFEKQFNLTLPDCLKEFYKNYNSTATSFMFTEILGMTNIISDYDEYPALKELVDEKFVPIANDNGDFICMDTKQNKDQLFYFSHEDENLSKTNMTIEAFIQDLIRQKIETQ